MLQGQPHGSNRGGCVVAAGERGLRRAVAAVSRELASGAIPKGGRMPLPAKMAARLECDEETVERAYRILLERGVLCGPNYPRVRENVFACSWRDLEDPSFEPPLELARAVGRHFSYRSEEPREPLHLKVTRDRLEAVRRARQHGHDFHELVLITDGGGVHLHGRERYPVFSGDCFAILPGETHGYATDSGLSVVNVIFYEDVLVPHIRLLTELPGFTALFAIEPLFRKETSFRHKLHLGLSAMRTAMNFVEHIEREQVQREPGCRMAILGQFMQLVVHVSRCYSRTRHAGTVQTDLAGKQRVVEQAVAYLERNSTRGVSVPELARTVFLSQSRLQHLFKETTGMSLLEYLLQVRVDHACSLLRDTRLPVSHIAAAVGFHDRAYFARQFRRKTGVTPLQYRKRRA